MKRRNAVVLLVLFFVLLSIMMIFAFSGTQSVTPAPPSSGDFSVALSTNPVSPAAGEITLVADVLDRNGRPVDGADVQISASHTTMAGMNISGKATAQGKGRYAIRGNMAMGGAWRAKVMINSPGARPFTQEFDLAVK